LRSFEGLSFAESARVLGIDDAAARKRHARALLRLHAVLSEDGVSGPGS
jgi:DNA-directed RNA polymerase specialized sigma24 family protein